MEPPRVSCDDETVESLLSELRALRADDRPRSDEQIILEARRCFFAKRPDRMETLVSDLEALEARTLEPAPRKDNRARGKRPSIPHLAAWDRFWKRVEFRMGEGKSEYEAEVLALKDEAGGVRLPDDWANERALNPELPAQPPAPKGEPDEYGSARDRVRKRIEASRKFWKLPKKPSRLRKTPSL